ncbi:AAA family ATPase [Hydrogenophaga luteola]|uniref:AAA family ATPase n=1 Tax=Hydrogenophaga luteola TaxID=1591122 RepID=A0ABV7W386_9BURK
MDEMKIRVAVAQGGVMNTRPKTAEYASLAAFVHEWEEPTPIPDNSPESKKGLPYFVGGVVSGKRHDSNVIERTMLTLDIEAPADAKKQPPRPQVVSAALKGQGVEFWLYTTASHETAKPRYRIVLPLAKPLPADADTLRTATLEAAALAGVADWCASESWVLSQPMFLPATVDGKAPKTWRNTGTRFAPSGKPTKDAPADIPDEHIDPVLRALQRAGLYLREDAAHKGKHYITCPWDSEHGKPTAGDGTSTQTVYYEAHHDGNPRPAAHCLDTAPDEGGKPHLTYRTLVNWLRENGHLAATEENADTEAELEEPETFWDGTAIGHMLDTDPTPTEFAIRGLAPVGKVTVLAGPGGVSKSSLALRVLLAAATGSSFGPFTANKPMRCMYLSYEDDAQTFHNRIHAMYAALSNSVEGMLYDTALVYKNLRIAPVADQAASWTLMQKDGRFGAAQATERLRWLTKLLKEQRVRLLVIDPVAYAHHLEESSPGEIAQFMQAMGRAAAEARCAILMLHHMHKTALWASLEDIHQGSLRGASSFGDYARSVAVLVSMPQKDAPAYGLPATHETVGRYAVFKHVKHNYSESLGVHVFERKGPLLVPTDIAQLSPLEVAETKAQQKQEERERKLDMATHELLEYLHMQPNHTAKASAVSVDVFRKHTDSLGVVDWCIAQGYLTVPEVKNGQAKPYTLTPKGVAFVTG